jgi:hypothetical protein
VKLITQRDEFRHIVRARIELDDPETEIGRLKTAVFHMMQEFQRRLDTIDESNEVERRRLTRHFQAEAALYEKLYDALTPQAELPWPEDEQEQPDA